MEVKLKIIQELPVQEGVGKDGKPWKVAGYVGETFDQYPRKVAFEIFGEDNITKNPCHIDDVVNVLYNIESREFNGRWYTSIRAYRVEEATPAAQPVEKKPEPAPQVPGAAEASNKLPWDQ